jgi:hypothetical protein
MTFIRKIIKAHFAIKQKAEKVNSDLITFSEERALKLNIKEKNLALRVSKQAEKEKNF